VLPREPLDRRECRPTDAAPTVIGVYPQLDRGDMAIVGHGSGQLHRGDGRCGVATAIVAAVTKQ
jgi:hypothetical protein